MPVAKRASMPTRAFIVLSATVLAIALLTGAMVLYLVDNGNDVRLGDNQFSDLRSEKTARRIAEEGPIQFPDVSGGSRIINLSHVGDDPGTGWYVFDAREPGGLEQCILDWVPAREAFVDRCDSTNTYPLNGAGLRQYAVDVAPSGRLVIDFNVDPRTTTTFATTTTTTTRPG